MPGQVDDANLGVLPSQLFTCCYPSIVAIWALAA